MDHLTFAKSRAAVVLALGAVALASAAHAGSDVHFSIGVQVPGFYVQSTPIYVQPRPLYTPSPGYYQRYDSGRGSHEQQHWQGRGPRGDHDRDGIINVYDSGNSRNMGRQARLYGPYGDLDRDGIINQHDRDRDGDGVRNRNDRFPNTPSRR